MASCLSRRGWQRTLQPGKTAVRTSHEVASKCRSRLQSWSATKAYGMSHKANREGALEHRDRRKPLSNSMSGRRPVCPRGRDPAPGNQAAGPAARLPPQYRFPRRRPTMRASRKRLRSPAPAAPKAAPAPAARQRAHAVAVCAQWRPTVAVPNSDFLKRGHAGEHRLTDDRSRGSSRSPQPTCKERVTTVACGDS